MLIGTIGLNHQTATVALRETLAISDAKKIDAMLMLLDQGVCEVVILGTCGRFEIYFCTPTSQLESSLKVLVKYFEDVTGEQAVKDYLYIKTGAEAIKHMALVAIGLDSIVLGEDQIIGQMKRAHDMAKSMGCTSRYLNVLFRDAITHAKRVKTELKISQIPQSLSYMGVKILNEIKPLNGLRVLIVGLGEMGQLAMQYAYDLGATISITNRSQSKVESILSRYKGLEVVPYKDWTRIVESVDVIICSTASPHIILKRSDLNQLGHPLMLLDLAMPKDIEEDVRTLECVTLINIDDLTRISQSNTLKRHALVAEAQDRISSHVEKIEMWMDKEPVHKALRDLSVVMEEAHGDAMGFVDKKLELDAHERAVVEKAMKAALKRVIRQPIVNLNALTDYEERKQALYWFNQLML